MSFFRIIEGHVLTSLGEMPDESVDCCVTSPPYWGLRAYQTTPQVWDGSPDCPHEWGDEQFRRGPAGVHGSTSQRAGRVSAGEQTSAGKPQGCWCGLCGAWRGEFGLEPTPDLYVQHAAIIFREVRRVMSLRGTLWLNIGDSHANDTKWGGTSGGKNSTSAAGGYQGQRVRRGKDCDPKRGAAALGQPMGHVNGSGLKPKDLVGIPWMLAFALRADGWWLRMDCIWRKPNCMPESVTDRPTKNHEYLFLLTKSEQYHYDAEAIKEPATGNAHDRARKSRAAEGQKAYPTSERNGIRRPGVNPKAAANPEGSRQNASWSAAVTGTVDDRNKRSVWTINTTPFPGAHFAVMPEALVEPCILAGCAPGGTVLDPFSGSGTVGVVALRHGRSFVGLELNPKYARMARRRIFRSRSMAIEQPGDMDEGHADLPLFASSGESPIAPDAEEVAP